MDSVPSEVVFSLGTGSGLSAVADFEARLFRYSDGPVKVPGPWKRGRPKGSANKVSKERNVDIGRHPSLSYEFINISGFSGDVDQAARARIRRHAKLTQSGRKRDRSDTSTGQHEAKNQASKIVRPGRHPSRGFVINPNLQQIQGVDPFDQSPVKLEPYMHDLLQYYTDTVWKNFYSLENLAGYNPIAEYWLFLAFKDSALIHTFISCAAAFASRSGAIINEARELRHLYEIIFIVNRRLQEARHSISGTTLAVIAGMAMLEQGAGRHENWKIHMEGLKGLVDDRGGIETLFSTPFLLNKIYRADLYGALEDEQALHFDGPSPLLTLSSSNEPFHSEGLTAVSKVIGLDQSLFDCVHQLEDAMRVWSDADGQIVAASASQHDSIIPTPFKRLTSTQVSQTRHLLTKVQYTLLSGGMRQDFAISTQHERPSEYIRLALVLYSVSILREPQPSKPTSMRIIASLRRVCAQLVSQLDNAAIPEAHMLWVSSIPIDFHIWVVFLAATAIVTTESETKGWLFTFFVHLTSSEYGNIYDWHELRCRLSRYLWVPSVHDYSSWLLWSEVTNMRQKILQDRVEK